MSLPVYSMIRAQENTEGMGYPSPLSISPNSKAVNKSTDTNGFVSAKFNVVRYENTNWTQEFPQYSLMFLNQRLKLIHSDTEMNIPLTRFHHLLALPQVNVELHRKAVEKKGNYSIEEAYEDWKCIGSLQTPPEMIQDLRQPSLRRVLDVHPFDGGGYVLNHWGPEVAGHKNTRLGLVLKKVPVGRNLVTNYGCSPSGSHIVPIKQDPSVTMVPRFVPVFSTFGVDWENDLMFTDEDGTERPGFYIKVGSTRQNDRFAPSLANEWIKETAATDMVQSYSMGPIEAIIDVDDVCAF